MINQPAPFAVQVELVRGCVLQCSFCGISAFQERPNTNFRYAPLEVLDRIATQVAAAGWNSRIEFARGGEPSVHPQLHEAIRLFRAKLPNAQLMLTSNGAGFARRGTPEAIWASVEELFTAGLTILALDHYTGITFVPKVRAALALHSSLPVRDYPADPTGNPHRRASTPFVTIIEDISQASKGTHSTLNNHAGFGGPLRDYPQRCAKPFRELSFDWDGHVNLCCIDWLGEYPIANITEMPLEELWNHPRFEAARRHLYHKQRDALRPCAGCDHPSYRVGLLPDKLGKATEPYPTAEDVALVQPVRIRERPTAKAMQEVFPHLTPAQQAAWEEAR